MIRVRKPRTDDPYLIRIVREELIPLNPPGLRPELSDNEIIRRLDEAAETYVWVSRSAVQGFITMLFHTDVLFVDMLAVHRYAQGGGIGSRLLQKAARFGIRHGCRRMQLYVNEGNRKGIEFYQRHGMTIVSYDYLRRSYVMEKPLP